MKEDLVEAVFKTRRVATKQDAEVMVDAVLDTIEEETELVSRAYWKDFSQWGTGESDHEPYEEGTVSAILKGLLEVFRG